MTYPSISPTTAVYHVVPSDEHKIIKSGSGPGLLHSILPYLGMVQNGFTVGFARTRGMPHTITTLTFRPENIAVCGGYWKNLTLQFENEVVLLTIDEVGNWRITGGSRYF